MSRFKYVLALVGITVVMVAGGCGSNAPEQAAWYKPWTWLGPNRTGADYRETTDFTKGKKAYADKRYGEAITILSTFVESNPTNIYVNEGSLLMGQAAEKTQKYELAIQAYSKVVESSEAPFDYKNIAYLGRGNCYFEMDMFKEALHDYRYIEKHYINSYNVDPAEVITKIGLTYKMLNDSDNADDYFVRILDDFNHTDFVIDAAANHTKLGQLDPSGKGRISVIAAIYLSKEKADATAVKVQGLGFRKVCVEQAPTGEFMVLVDKFVSPREAKSVLKTIKNAGLKDSIMVPDM